MNKGELIAKEVAKLFKGECGPFGGRDPIVSGNELTLQSQSPEETYQFTDDGKVNFLYTDENISDLGQEAGMSEDEVIEFFSDFQNMDVLELLQGKTDLSWFMYLDENENYEQVISKIKNILAN